MHQMSQEVELHLDLLPPVSVFRPEQTTQECLVTGAEWPGPPPVT